MERRPNSRRTTNDVTHRRTRQTRTRVHTPVNHGHMDMPEHVRLCVLHAFVCVCERVLAHVFVCLQHRMYFHTHARARTHMHMVDRLVTGGQGASGRASAAWYAHATCGLSLDLKTSGPITQCHKSNVQRGSASL